MPKLGASAQHSQRLLQLIYDHSKISRSDLCKVTGYSTFLVSKVCDELIAGGFIAEVGSGDSTGGRRPTLLSITPGLGVIVGVHMGTVNTRIAVMDIMGNVQAFARSPSQVRQGPEAGLHHVVDQIEETLKKAALKVSDLDAIGVGISGVFDQGGGISLFWPKVPQWLDVPVYQRLSEYFKKPIAIEDTPRTMALAERRFGPVRGAEDLVYITLGAGVGSAVFLGGKLHRGRDGVAGELGHVTVDEDGPICPCGNRGCLETMVSATALVKRARAGIDDELSSQLWQLCQGRSERLSVETIVEAAHNQDRFSHRILTEAGAYLGKALVGLVHLLNPEHIILGGGLALAGGDILLPAARSVLQERAMPATIRNLELEVSSLGDVDWTRGAGLLVAKDVLARRFEATARRGRKPKSASHPRTRAADKGDESKRIGG